MIAAFNADMPFDQFARLQIAGDQMPESTGDRFARLAGLGFIGLGAEYYKNSAKEQAIADELDDRVDTLTRGFLGLTVACARCHDHKFDPIPQQDYYSLAGVFNGFKPVSVPLVPKAVVEKYDAAQKTIAEQDKAIEAFLATFSRAETDAAAGKTADYLTAARKIAELRKKGEKVNAGKFAGDAGLDVYILTRWERFLPRKEAQSDDAFRPWFDLQPDSSEKDVAKAAETAAKAVIAANTAEKAGGKPDKAVAKLVNTLFKNRNGPFAISADDSEKRYLPESNKPELAESVTSWPPARRRPRRCIRSPT